MPIPEPEAKPNEGARLRSESGARAGEPGALDRREQRQQHAHESLESPVPSSDSPSRAGADLPGRTRTSDVPRARAERCLPLVEREVPVGADISRKEPVIPVAPSTVEDQNPLLMTVEVPVPPAIRDHLTFAPRADHRRDRAAGPRVGVAGEGGEG